MIFLKKKRRRRRYTYNINKEKERMFHCSMFFRESIRWGKVGREKNFALAYPPPDLGKLALPSRTVEQWNKTDFFFKFQGVGCSVVLAQRNKEGICLL